MLLECDCECVVYLASYYSSIIENLIQLENIVKLFELSCIMFLINMQLFSLFYGISTATQKYTDNRSLEEHTYVILTLIYEPVYNLTAKSGVADHSD